MTEWQTYSFPDSGIQLKFPNTTPSGKVVKKTISDQGEIQRIHLYTQDHRELYFEIRIYPGQRDLREEYRLLREGFQNRFQGFSITEMEPSSLGSVPAQKFTFAWEAGVRTVFFVQKESYTCRVIYDPRSTLNAEVLATLRFGQEVDG